MILHTAGLQNIPGKHVVGIGTFLPSQKMPVSTLRYPRSRSLHAVSKTVSYGAQPYVAVFRLCEE